MTPLSDLPEAADTELRLRESDDGGLASNNSASLPDTVIPFTVTRYRVGPYTYTNLNEAMEQHQRLERAATDRKTDRGPQIELRDAGGRGEGVFALRDFAQGETILIGVLETNDVANHSHASQLGENAFGFHGGLTSKFNHSCDPNCGIRLNETGAHDFVAMRDIARGEETTFDYAMRNYRIEHFPSACVCGSKICRGEVTGWQKLPQSRKDEYAGFVAPYLIEMDRKRLES